MHIFMMIIHFAWTDILIGWCPHFRGYSLEREREREKGGGGGGREGTDQLANGIVSSGCFSGCTSPFNLA